MSARVQGSFSSNIGPRIVWVVVASLLAAACGGGSGGGSSGGVQAAGGDAPVGGQRPVPIESAFEVTGPAELNPGVQIISLENVRSMAHTGTSLTVDSSAVDLDEGALFVVPGVASGRVARVESGTDGSVMIHFEQPPVADLFDVLDVSFGGRPDPDHVIWETDGATESMLAAAIEFLELEDLEDLTDPDEASGVSGAQGASAVSPTSPAELGATVRVAAIAVAQGGGDPDAADDPTEGAADDGEDPDGPDRAGGGACGPAGDGESGTDNALASPGTQEFSVTAEDYTVEVRHRLDSDCGTHYFKINATRDDSVELTGSLFGWVTSDSVAGEMVLEGESIRSTVDLEVSGQMWFSVAGQVNASMKPSGIKITYDLVKKDMPVVIAGVPFLVRLGVPLTMEARMPSVGDTLVATLLHLSCDGRFNTSGVGTPESTCTMAPVEPHIAESFAPMAFVFAAGFKTGFGPGVSIPMGGSKTSTVYAGATATLSGSTGFTRSGIAGASLIDCSRIDRSVQLNVGAETEVFGLVLAGSTNIWDKSATDHWGRQCPETGMSD